jgi:hypothetical protein
MRTMAWSLVWVAASLASAAGKTEGVPPRYFDLGGDVVRVDSFESARGCVDVPIRRAGLERASSLRGAPLFLGSSEEDVLQASGRDLRVARWETVATRRICRFADGASVSVRVGNDELSLFLPSIGMASVTINGGSVDVPPSELGDASAYEGIASRVGNPEAFASGMQTLVSLTGPVDEPPVVPSSSCFWPCFRCGSALAGLIVGGTAALVATCGAAVATAGGLTPACVAGGVAYFSGALAVADACLGCDACLNPKPPPGGGGPDCPDGSHACCNDRCCASEESDLCE